MLENADHLLKHASFADANPPDVVVRIGNSPTSKSLRLWLERTKPAHHLVVDPDERWNDATFLGGTVVRQTVLDLFSAQSESGFDRGATGWTNTWTSADARAGEVIGTELDSGPLLEAAVARLSYANTPDHGVFYVSNSMPVRDLDSFATRRAAVPLALGNRGASGIDGVVSSAAGAARTGRPVVLLIGDIATLHDIGGLIDAARRDIDLTIVMVNNNGGGIFSFLPIASHDDVNFDEIFHTPHGTVYDSLPGVRHQLAATGAELTELMASAVGTVGTDL
ncbi:MAG: 2-succinyl-5-enolpyruvyl-6-hydroxy-3-cyclohexene-1-carboxylate synthase, partial [Actinobacteria bacterium]|nr:2-succinyl-5-enolpyruvyl-6-hydroxy-3-cyclohexene-1-carboxylate synthase [Actinomycetota bacterium]